MIARRFGLCSVVILAVAWLAAVLGAPVDRQQDRTAHGLHAWGSDMALVLRHGDLRASRLVESEGAEAGGDDDGANAGKGTATVAAPSLRWLGRVPSHPVALASAPWTGGTPPATGPPAA